MNKIKCAIIEDEKPAIEELKCILKSFEFIEIKAEFHDGKLGLNWIMKNSIDAVFLGINMTRLNGLDLAREITKLDKNIHLIFITNHEDYALEAFEIGALDYILKPLKEKRMEKTLLRLKEHVNKASDIIFTEKIKNVIKQINDFNKLKKLACQNKGKMILINPDDIYFCFIENDETLIKTKDKIYKANYNLNEIEEKTGFFRIHRSYIVNLNKIIEIYPWFNGTYKITMDDVQKTELQVSRSKVRDLKRVLGI